MVTREYFLKYFDIDIDTGIIRWKVSRPHVKIGDIAGRYGKGGYRRIRLNGKVYPCHHIIWFIAKGYWPIELDHIDTNGLNNSIGNLREATKSQNQWNQKIPKNNTSGYKGVTWHKKRQKWQAGIWVNNKRKHLGLFDQKENAAIVYNEAAIKYHGKFAKLNEVIS